MTRLTKAQVQSVVDEHGFTADNTAGLMDETLLDLANGMLKDMVYKEGPSSVEQAEYLCDALADRVINEL